MLNWRFAKKQYDHLLPTVNRLLELEPNNKQAQRLREEFKTQVEDEPIKFSDHTATSPSTDSRGIGKTILMWGVPILLLMWGVAVWYSKTSTISVAFEIEKSLIEDDDVRIKIDGIVVDHAEAKQQRNLSTGMHQLEIVREGKVVSTSKFNVVKEETAPIRIALNTVQPQNNHPNTRPNKKPVVIKPDHSQPLWEVPQSFARTPLPDGLPGIVAGLKGHTGTIIALQFSPDGRTIASSNENRIPTIRFWDLKADEEIQKHHPPKAISAIEFSPNGDNILMGYHGLGLSLLKTSYLRRVTRFKIDAEEHIDSVMISQDGTKGMSCSRNGKIRIWDLKTGKLLKEIQNNIDAGFAVYSASFLPRWKTNSDVIFNRKRDSAIRPFDRHRYSHLP